MLSKEEIESKLEQTEDDEITINLLYQEVDLLKSELEQLETNNKKLIETNDKYLQKLVYALTPTTHELSTYNNNEFKQIIADNIDLETCKIRRKLKEFWGVDKY